MHISRTNIGPTIRAANDPKSSERKADIIWLSSYASQLSAKDGAALANMSPSGFKKIQSGENAIRFENLTFWMRRDPVLAAMYAAHVGLILPGEAEYAGALTRAVNARARMEADRK